MSLEMNSEAYLTLAFERRCGWEMDWEEERLWKGELGAAKSRPRRLADMDPFERLCRAPSAPSRAPKGVVEHLPLPPDPF